MCLWEARRCLTEVPRMSTLDRNPLAEREPELTQTPASQRGGVSGTAEPSSVPSWLAKAGPADSSTDLLGLELTAACFLAVDKSLEQIWLRRA